MKRRTAGRLFLFAGLAVCLAGCAAILPPKPGREGVADSSVVVRIPERDALREFLQTDSDKKRAFKALVRMRLTSGSGPGGRFQAVLWAKKPDRLRIMGLTPFGGTLFDFVMRGDDFEVYVPSSSEIVGGKIDALRGLDRFGGFATMKDVWTLAGEIPDVFLQSWDDVAIAAAGREIVLSLPLQRERVAIDPETYDLVREERATLSGDPGRRIVLKGYEGAPDVRHPTRIEVTGGEGEAIEFDVKEWFWNPVVNDRDLEPAVPDGTKFRRLERAPS